jgi:hypothetical protein
MSEVSHLLMLWYARWRIYYYMREIGNLSAKDGLLDSLSDMMSSHLSILASMIINAQNVRILRSSTSGLILFRIL